MESPERKEFSALLAQVMSFYKQDVTEFSAGVWWQSCAEFDLGQVRKAFTRYAMDADRGRFPPLPADIVRQLQGTHGDRSLVAWGRVYDAMRRIGAYETVSFEGDPAIHAAITDMGGWVGLCRSQTDELPFLQKRFCELYRTYLSRDSYEYASALAGATAIENGAKGFGGGDIATLVHNRAGGAPTARLGATVKALKGVA